MDFVASGRRHISISVTRVLLTRGHMVQTQADGWRLETVEIERGRGRGGAITTKLLHVLPGLSLGRDL